MVDLVKELKDEAAILLQNLTKGDEKDYWHANRVKLLNSIINDDVSKFLDWEVMRHTMYIANAEYIRTERNALEITPKYAAGLIETTVGSPVLSKHYEGTSDNLIHHAYHVQMFERTTQKDITSMKSILEFGGGYGSMCRLIHNLDLVKDTFKRYTIFDLPEFVILQKFFLKSLGFQVCNSVGEQLNIGGIYCTSNLEDLQPEYDLFIGTWSISETAFEFRNKVLERKINNFLLAYQNKFEDVENMDYFEALTYNFPLQWKGWKIEHLYGGQHYLMGW